MASFVSVPFKKLLGDAGIDFPSDTIRALLVDATFNGDEDDEFVADPAVLGELVGTGYVRKDLATKTNALDTPNSRAEWDADDVTWTAIDAGTAAGVLLYKFITNDAASPIIAFIDTGGFPVTTNGGDLGIQWNAEGILHIT